MTGAAAEQAPAEPSAKPSVSETIKKTPKRAKRKRKARKKRRKKSKRQRWPTRRPKALPKTPPKLGNIPFQEGERLSFRVNMLGAVAGEVILAVGKRTKYAGHNVVPLVGFLRSSDFLSNFYPIDNKLVVLADERTFQPIKTDFVINENGKHIEYHTVIDQKRRFIRSTRKKKGKTVKRNFTAVTDIYEAMTSVYGVRRMDLKPGMSFGYYVWDGRKERLVEVKVVGQEKVWTPAGWFETMKMTVSSRITGGFVKPKVLKKKPLEGTIWIGMDPQRTPVKAVTPTKLGDAEAILVRRWIETSPKL